MKKTMTILAVAAGLIAGQTMTASAINKEWSAALGFLGGMMFANAHNDCRTYSTVYEPVVIQQPVYVRPWSPPPVVIQQPVVTGHYEYQERQEWVPGCWVYEKGRGRCNPYVRVWRPGYYRIYTVKIWVQDSPGYCYSEPPCP